MNKHLLLFLILIITAFTFTSCEKYDNGDKEEILVNINGEWDIYYENQIDGEIIFDEYETFMLSSSEKPVLFGNMSILPNKSNILSIYYIEDENGEEYSYDGYCVISPYTQDSVKVSNLPYYENKDVTLVRK